MSPQSNSYPSSSSHLTTSEEPPSSQEEDSCCSHSLPLWQQLVNESISSAQGIARLFDLPKEEIINVCQKYPARINPYYLSLIKTKDDAIYKQCIPDRKEIEDTMGDEDPLHEEPARQARQNVPPLLTHRYPDRVLFLVSNQCSMYCRFCTRKRKVGDSTQQPTWDKINKALDYLKAHEEIRDVILSGGDPLMLDDEQLEKVIKSVYDIMSQRKNGIIRIGSRVPCSLPQRITPTLCQMLKKYHPLYLNTHFNHPAEITKESRRACQMLTDAGIPLGCQTVLLKEVNDEPEVMKELMQGLISMRVKPYYIYQADPVKGTNHFRTKVEKGLEIYQALRGYISGLCLPTFVIDAPGGGGKIPLLPNYLIELRNDKVILRNYEGRICEYPQVR